MIQERKRGTHSEETLGKVYDILVESAGARDDAYDKRTFVHSALEWDYNFNFEYRFMGSLGGGGKIWLPLDGDPYVNCYRENETPERKSMMEETNRKLSALVKA